ncbi:hypothetical protein [Enemella evansiae]|uniref:hypothetical protein n=1 Tax=Enemella evansiae TaxID=2016499 RepID=UPI001E2EEF32|nr:hypothetical protein [Enemella evansiae]
MTNAARDLFPHPDHAVLTRRALLGVGGSLAAAGLLAGTARPAAARQPFRIAVATNEPWGTYHVRPMLDEVAARGGTLTQLVPDRSGLPAGDPVTALPLATANPRDVDVLVVSGATDWPARAVRALPGVPVVASGLAYLNPTRAPYAAEVAARITAATAGSNAEQQTFAAHLGIRPQQIRVVGIPELDDLPERRPEPGTVLILTSVTYPDATGGAAPGTELLLASARALAAQGKRIIVGLHPRENPALWSEFEIAAEGSLAASARAEVAIGIPGTVFPKIAAVGTPLVGVVADGLNVPAYLLSVCTPARTLDEVLAAVTAARPVSRQELREVVGPMGRAGRTLVQAWYAASRAGAR